MSKIEQFLTDWFGPNYRTTVSGFISTVSILASGIALNQSSVAALPESWRGPVLAVAGPIFFISQLYKNAATADARNVVVPPPATPPTPPANASQIRNG